MYKITLGFVPVVVISILINTHANATRLVSLNGRGFNSDREEVDTLVEGWVGIRASVASFFLEHAKSWNPFRIGEKRKQGGERICSNTGIKKLVREVVGLEAI